MIDPHQINLNHLRYFYEVARAGNMRRAASRIGISQPALSKQIQALEDSIGLQLFFRTPKGLQPTPDGELVFSYCERMFGHLRDLEEALDLRRKGSAGRLTVGSINSISTHLLPGFLRRYHEAFPKVRLRLTTARSRRVLRSLAEHRIDVGLIADKPNSELYEARAFMHSPLIAVASPQNTLAQQARELAPGKQLSPQALSRHDLITFDAPAPTRRISERYLARLGVTPRVIAECPAIETIISMVTQNIGFAILPAHCVEQELQHGTLVTLPIESWELSRTLYVVWLKAPHLQPSVRHFLDLFPEINLS